MKTYVITVSERFPKKHKREGQKTFFPTSIHNGIKIHTIRSNFDLWKKRFKQIDAGKAELSVRIWTSKPYRSKQKELFRFDKSDGIGIERLDFSGGYFNTMLVNGEYCFTDIENSIAKNDGLLFEDFKCFFDPYDLTKPLAIIHLTSFRYCK